MRRATEPTPVLRLRSPQDLIEAVPYLLGFHPQDSVVLVGFSAAMASGEPARVRLTARLDLDDAATAAGARHGAAALAQAEAVTAMALIYQSEGQPAHSQMLAVAEIEEAIAEYGIELESWVFVGDEGWALGEYVGDRLLVSPPSPRDHTSLIPAEATYAGLAVRPDRGAVAELIGPEPAHRRDLLLGSLRRRTGERTAGSPREIDRTRRSDVRALFGATRALPVLDASQTVRFGAALADIAVRDACWWAIEAGRISGEGLWRELARALPDEYRTPPLFLFGWEQWRAGNGALASIAVDTALECDPTYRAADLLADVLSHGLNPFHTPRLRKSA